MGEIVDGVSGFFFAVIEVHPGYSDPEGSNMGFGLVLPEYSGNLICPTPCSLTWCVSFLMVCILLSLVLFLSI